MKIGIISTHYPSEKISKYVFVHVRAKEYIKNGHEVRVFTRKELDKDRYEYEGVKVKCGSILRLKKEIQLFNPDIILDHGPSMKFSIWLHPMIRNNYPIISWFHGFEVMDDYPGLNKIVGKINLVINSMLLKKDNAYVGVSEWMLKQAIRNCKIDRKKSHVIPNFIDTKKFKYKKRDYTTIKAISLRNLMPKYGMDIGIKSINVFDFDYHIYGFGSKKYYEYLMNLIKNRKTKIKPGTIPHEKVPKLYSEYNLFIAPSRTEAQGVAMMEAMSTGMPVITTNVGGIPEFVRDEKDGFIVEPEEKVFEDAIRRFLMLPEKKKILMGKNARESAIECDKDIIIKKELELMQKIRKTK